MPLAFLSRSPLPCAGHRQMHDPVVVIVFSGAEETELSVPALQLGLGAELDLRLRSAKRHGTLHEFPGQAPASGFCGRCNPPNARSAACAVHDSHSTQHFPVLSGHQMHSAGIQIAAIDVRVARSLLDDEYLGTQFQY